MMNTKLYNTIQYEKLINHFKLITLPWIYKKQLQSNPLKQGMAEQPIANKEGIRNFQQKIMNRSIADLMCFEGLADYLLECCSAQAKANTLSFCSFLPIFLTSIFITGPTRLWFILTAISLFLHQILDIANKKQAYRLQSFSFGTYYFDHTCDTFSAMLIVYIIGTLFSVSYNWIYLMIFVFAILPFYVHHLTMYYTEYMCFPTISPTTQGLVILEILCIVGLVKPDIFMTKFGGSEIIGFREIVVAIASVWLLVFIALDLRDIVKASTKFNQGFPLKNLFVVLVIGYVMFQNAIIQPNIINSSKITFGLYLYSIMLCFAMIIGQLLLKYASSQKFQQISANTLAVTTLLTLVYAICALGNLDIETENVIGISSAVILALIETGYYLWRSRTIMKFINQAINQ